MRMRRLILLSTMLLIQTSLPLDPVRAQTSDLQDSRAGFRAGLIDEAGYTQLNDTPLNDDNALVPQVRRENFAAADLFLYNSFAAADFQVNARWNDWNRAEYKGVVRELYLDRDFGDYVHLTLGRKILKWGTGFAFNPTGVMEPARRAVDPLDRLSQYQGRQIAALDAFIGRSSLTLLYANEARWDGGLHRGRDEAAARFSTLLRDVDIALVGYWGRGVKSRVGFNTAWTSGQSIELHSEFIAQQGSDKRYHAVLDSSRTELFFRGDPYQARFANSASLFYKLLLGGQYTFDSGLNLMAEYYYNREGLDAQEWRRWRQFILFQRQQMAARPPAPLAAPNFYGALATLGPEGTMRHYFSGRLIQPLPRATLELSLFLNLADGSGIFLPSFTWAVNPLFTGWLRISQYFGAERSEFGMLFIRQLWQTGGKIAF